MSQVSATISAPFRVEVDNGGIQEEDRAMSVVFFDDYSADHPGRQAGKHCDACNEWLEPSDTHCPSCGSER